MKPVSYQYEEIKTEVLIIGAGAAGVRAAIELTQHRVRCLVIGKRAYGDAHTIKAAGGINASLGNLDPEDRWEIHAADTLREGHFLNDPLAVEIICKAAPYHIEELHKWGCNFNKTPEGKINQRYFGAQSFRRTCFVGDRTGEAILQTLIRKAKELEVPYLQNIYITKILTREGIACGAVGIDFGSKKFLVFKAKAIVLAAGGHSGIYTRHSSRENENTGDGAALAYRAGVALQDMELVQFHPTGMVKPDEFKGTLVTEATRGEGGRLFNSKRERFMEKYSPEKMELDARDVVARAIYREIEEGRGTENEGVYLDISHRDKDFIKKRLPVIYQRFKKLGVDITKEPMEIAPTAHYAMGGVEIDFSTAKTSMEGLLAVGEVTSGMHGANRLGGNSLLETIVMGKICGATIISEIIGKPHTESTSEDINQEIERIKNLQENNGSELPEDLISDLRKLMWKHAGIIRNATLMNEGIEKIEKLKVRNSQIKVKNDQKNGLEAALNLDFMLFCAETVLRSALFREESRGAHYREDFPESSAEWAKNILCQKDSSGNFNIKTKEPAPINESIKSTLKEKHSLDYHHLE